MSNRRIITTDAAEEDIRIEGSLRPQSLAEYIGQEKAKSNLKVYIEAAKSRGEPLDHVLFYGPPGLGKTTLAGIIANEMGTHMKVTSGPAIEKPGEVAAVLNSLQEGDVLFVDEIHRLSRQVEEVLYPAMEDYAIDIMIGKGASARSIRLDLPRFTLVGATTRAGLLTAPLRDRFGVVHHLEYYTVEELATIIRRSSEVLDVEIEKDGVRLFLGKLDIALPVIHLNYGRLDLIPHGNFARRKEIRVVAQVFRLDNALRIIFQVEDNLLLVHVNHRAFDDIALADLSKRSLQLPLIVWLALCQHYPSISCKLDGIINQSAYGWRGVCFSLGSTQNTFLYQKC